MGVFNAGDWLYPDISQGRQPQYPGPIISDRSITRQLVIAYSGTDRSLNLAANKPATLGAAKQTASKDGLGLTYASVSNAGVKLNTSTLLTNGFVGSTAGITVLVLANPAASTTRYIPFCAASGVQPEFYLVFNANKALAATSGMFSVITDGGNGGEVSGAVNGKSHVFVVSYATPGSTPNLYVDGVELGANKSIASGSALCSASSFDNVGGYSASGYAANGFSIPLELAWNRKLSPAEILSVSQQLWQIFQAPPIDIWTPSAAAPGGFQAAWARNRSYVIGAGAR